MGVSKIVAVIHARGGSKRIPLKNIKPLNGIPLVAYMVRAALKAPSIERVIVSTDHPEIKRIALEYGAEVPFDRPAAIAEDVASELVTQHAVRFIEDAQGSKLDLAVTLQPTTPFCSGDDIEAVIQKVLGDPEITSAITVKDVSERPEWMFHPDGKFIRSCRGIVFSGDVGISQTLPKLYYPNGAAYATRRDALFGENALITSRCAAHIMSREASVDIDEPIDFEFAAFIGREFFGK